MIQCAIKELAVGDQRLKQLKSYPAKILAASQSPTSEVL